MHLNQDNPEISPFLSTPSNSRLIQQISHLAEFGSNVIIVEGVEGIGKSRFASELSSHLLGHQSASIFVHIDVKDCVDSFSFLTNLCQKLGVVRLDDLDNDLGENLSALRRFVQMMIREHKLAVVVIDDADTLDSQVLGALLSVIQTGSEVSFGLHFVFMALPGFSQRIDGLCVLEAAVHDFQLPPLSQTELERFIVERYPSAQEWFHEEVISPRSLWVRSQGIPGVACDILNRELEVLRTPKRKLMDINLVKMPMVHIGVGSVLLGALILMFFMRSDDGEHQSSRHSLNIDTLSSNSNIVSEHIEPVVIEPLVDNASQMSLLADAPQPTDHPQKTLIDSNVDEHLLAVEVDSTVTVDSNSARKQTPLASSESSGIKVDVLKDKPAVAVSSGGYTFTDDEKVLMSLPPSSYVLQILAASHSESLQGYVARQPNKDKLHIYRGLRQGKPWYMVVLAPYASKKEALAAIKLLPKQQAKAGPWPKTVASVQSEISTFKNN